MELLLLCASRRLKAGVSQLVVNQTIASPEVRRRVVCCIVMTSDGNQTILVVDDESAVAEVVVFALRHGGYAACTAENGARAYEAASSQNFDLAVIDIGLPDVSGLDLADNLRELQPGLTILLITGLVPDELESPMSVARCRAPLLEKPFTPQKLLATVRKLLDPDRDSKPPRAA